MVKPLPRKPFYGLAELCEHWSLSEADIAAYALESELTLSIAVGGLRVETSEVEEDADGRPFSIPTGTRWIVGTMDIRSVDAWSVLLNGSQAIGRFCGVQGEVLDLPDQDDERATILVDRQSLVVRRAEMERFQEAQGIGGVHSGIAAVAGANGREKSRGAPPKFDWEGCWCEIAKTIYDPGPPATQAEWLRMIQDWFADQLGPDNVPCDSSIKARLSRIWPTVKPNVGRPSALTAVHGAAPSRPAEKVRVARR
ncbi:MAG: hypothetical protein K2X49_13875 [Acetobacteraceae bacterium]|jgi:hypothetical protein|nr:hypothetical protein [Acetobacteraceae bacterium]